jgi:hypothetical protein
MMASVGIDDVEFVPMDQDGYDVLRFPDFELQVTNQCTSRARRVCRGRGTAS